MMVPITTTVELDVHNSEVSPAGVSHFSWPVAREEMAAASEALLASFCSIARRKILAHSPARVLSVAPFYFVAEAIALLEAQLALTRWERQHIEPRIPTGWRAFRAVAAGRAPALEESALVRQLAEGPTRRARWRGFLRPLKRTLRDQEMTWASAPTVARRDEVAVTTTGSLISAHAAVSKESVAFVDYGQWFDPRRISAPPLEDAFVEAIEEVLSAVAHVYSTAGAELNDVTADYLRSWLKIVSSRSSGYLAALADAPFPFPRRLWIGTGASTWPRLLFLHASDIGSHVTAHDHGTGSGFRIHPEKTTSDLSVCNRFVTFTPQQVVGTRAQYAEDLLLQAEFPELTHVADPIAAQRSTFGRRSDPHKVMVLTNFFRGDSYHHGSVLADPVALDLQARLFARLTEFGYEVLHKPHPQGRVPSPAQLHTFGARVISGYFEDAIEQADVVLIVWDAPSSTLRTALASDLPVVILDIQSGAWRPEALEKLQRRCAVLRGEVVSDNRILVDWEALDMAIHESTGLNDDSFFESYFGGSAT